MSCYKPMYGWKSKSLTSNGKRKIVFNAQGGLVDMRVTVPCGKCMGCKLDKCKDWAVRCTHEAKMWEHNCFVTLTYNDKNVPMVDGFPTLRPRDFVLFMKKLRLVKPGVRFLQAGEYGKFGRPHHHVLLFNCWFGDAKRFKRRGEFWLYRSAELEKLWEFGFSSFGIFGAGSANYVTRYCLKKVGVKFEGDGIRCPEYQTMSRRPGIGRYWLEKYGSDVYPSDMVVDSNGIVSKPPRYYDDYLKKVAPHRLNLIKSWRKIAVMNSNPEEYTDRRLADKEAVAIARVKFNSKEEL